MDFFRLHFPLDIFLGGSILWAGILVLKGEFPSRFGRNTLALFLILWGVHKIDYPFLRPVEWFAPWGFILTSVLAFGILTGMILIYFESMVDRLKSMQNEVSMLSGLLPICASCKKIRDDEGYWNRIESYIEKFSDAKFSHGLCDACAESLYGEEDWFRRAKQGNTLSWPARPASKDGGRCRNDKLK